MNRISQVIIFLIYFLKQKSRCNTITLQEGSNQTLVDIIKEFEEDTNFFGNVTFNLMSKFFFDTSINITHIQNLNIR